MKRLPVSSSNLISIGYEPASETLEVEFKGGSIYQYSDVPSSVYANLMKASSKGSYFSSHVRKAGYSYRQIN